MTDVLTPVADEVVGWTDILGAVGGTVGVVSGLLFGFLSWRLSRRSARASERSALASEQSAETAASALTTSQQAANAADQAAEAAAVSAREAQKLATIESTRHHDELGPNVSAVFVWRPSRHGGAIYAEVTNNSRYDFWVTGGHVIDGAGTTPVAHDGLRAGATLDIFVTQLPIDDVGDPAVPWPLEREAYQKSQFHVMELNEAFHNARHRFGRLELLYRSTSEPCRCGRTPPESDGHWVTVHEIGDVSY